MSTEATAGALPPLTAAEGQDSGKGPPANPGASSRKCLTKEERRLRRVKAQQEYRKRPGQAAKRREYMRRYKEAHPDVMKRISLRNNAKRAAMPSKQFKITLNNGLVFYACSKFEHTVRRYVRENLLRPGEEIVKVEAL